MPAVAAAPPSKRHPVSGTRAATGPTNFPTHLDDLFRISPETYDRIVERDILTEQHRVELLAGYLVTKMPRDPEHDGTIDVIEGRLLGLLPAGWFVRSQRTVALIDSRPEPDLAVVRGSRQDYLQRHPGATDVGLLIEVANTSLERDRLTKAWIYAYSGVAVYWVVDLINRRVEVMSNPSGPANTPVYTQTHVYQVGDHVPVVLDGAPVGSIPVADLIH
jgi:Uma2 family endonuclease